MTFTIMQGDALQTLRTLPSESVQSCITSPPYWGLRDYGVEGQLGLEKSPELYVAKMVEVFREVRRVLRNDGTLWLNLGDSYIANATGGLSSKPSLMTGGRGTQEAATKRPDKCVVGMKPKDLCGIPWMVAFALRSDGWYLRQDIIWAKPNPMPESVRDRCTKSHEYIFLLSKSERYYYDSSAIAEESVTNDIRRPYGSRGAWEMDGRPEEQKHGGEARSWRGSHFDAGKTGEHQLGRSQKSTSRASGEIYTAQAFTHPQSEPRGPSSNFGEFESRNKRSVWNITTKPYSEAHFATFPPEIPEICIKAGTKEGDTVLDPFNGAGTTGLVATRLHRNYIGIELNPAYVEMSNSRIVNDAPLFNSPTSEQLEMLP